MMMMEPPLPPAQEPQQTSGNHQDDEEEKSPSRVTNGSHGGTASEAPAELSKSARGLVRMCDLLLKKKQQRQRRQQGAGALPASPTGAGPPGRSRRQKRSRTASSSDTDKSCDSGGSSSSQDDDDEEDEEEVSEVESFILDQDDLENPMLETASKLLLSGTADGTDLRTVDPETQARLEALLEAAGIGKLSTADGKAFADPEVLRRLTSSVSCALDEAAAALTRMRAESTSNAGQTDNRSLAEACSEGDVNAVRKLLIEGRSVNEHTEEGESLLCLACSAGYYELAQVLLAMHANVEDRGIKGDITPLMAAANGGHVEIVKLLLAHDADVNSQSSTGNTALTYACAGGYVDVVKVLLESGASIEDHNENGHTPLMEAGSAGHVEVARVLLENGAGINTHSNEFKESALTLACYKGHLEMVRFLLEAGADQEHKTDEMHTALMEACMDGHVEVARLLLDSGAQVNMPADSFESPLTLAACGGHVELAALLIERGANLEEVNDEGYTPLMEAAREGHEEMVALLLGQGANINAQTEETQETALTLACCGGFLEVADFLIKAGADIELGCSTPLMEAAQEGHLELVKYLLAAGANVHATTATGDTALTYACENGHTDVADVLLQAGADLEHESEGGRTPLMKAARAGHVCTVQFLISKGANVNRTTLNNDHTVLSLACAGGHLAVVELLLAHGADPTHRLKDGSTMLIEAAKGGHTSVVCYLLDYPNNLLSAPPPDVTQFTPPSHDLNRAPRVPMQALPMVVPPQEPDKPPANVATNLPIRNKVSGRTSEISNTPTHSIATSMSQPQTPTPSPIISPSAMLPIYPSIDIDAQTESNHDTALTLACAGGHEELVQTLLERGANIEHRDKKGFTPLILAATAGHVGVVEILLDNGADIEAQSERTKDTPLSLACSGGRQEVVELLLARGANKEHRNVSDYTPLSLAASGGYVNIIKILLNAGAEINSRTGSKLGISPLMLAAMNGHTAAVKLLLDMGSDINAQIETNRNTALTLACFQGRTDVVSLLLDRKANVEHRAKTGLTPLMEAASGGYAEVGRVLLDKGADVNAPPVPSSRDTALTIAADKGHYKFCELLISRGAHIDVRNKKGNTPLWLAANGGHLDVVQLLVQAGADVDAADNRKITPLMAAFRKGHVKVVRYLVKEVNQFPSDSECMRYIATITDKEMLKKCHLCMESIVQAKDRQAAEANKNASILLEELDLEKLREESRRLALAAKREKRKEKRRKKKEEQRRKLEEIEAKNKENFELQAALEKEKQKVEDEPQMLTEPPSATTTTTIGISATWTTLAGSHGKRNNTITTNSTKRKSRKNKIAENVQIIFEDQLPISYGQQEKLNGESKSSSTSESGDSDNMRISSCSDESSNSSNKSDNHHSSANDSSLQSKKKPSVLVSSPKEERKVPSKTSVKLSESLVEATSNSLSASSKTGPSPLTSPNGKLTIASPKRGQKREEGWKEVVRRSKKVSVPSTVISRVIGRGGCNINAIREFTGAHIDIDKQKDKTGDRIITIRGGTESTRQATHLINALIKDPDKEIDELIPKNRLKSSSANSKAVYSASTTVSSVNSSVMGIKVTAVTVSSSQAASALTVPAVPSASAHKPLKNPVNNVRPGFPVSLPLAYPPPQFAHALLAAQTFQQIRPPRLPMTHFGGPFPPAQSTWGPFPVRPLSPARATNSPKSHMMPRHNNQNFSSPQVIPGVPSSTSPTATTNSPATVPVSSTNGSLNSPSVRRQLFVTVVKTSNATTTTVTTTASNHITTPTASTCPVPTAKEHHPMSSPSSPSPPSLPGGGSRSSPSDCLTCSPNKGTSLSTEQDLVIQPVMEMTSSGNSKQASSTSGSTTMHSAHPHPPVSGSQDSRPSLIQTQVPPPPDPRMAPSLNLAVSGPTHQPAPIPSNIPASYPLTQSSIVSTPSAAKIESPAVRSHLHGTNPAHKNQVTVQNSTVTGIVPHPNIKRPQSVPSGPHPSSISTQSAAQSSSHPSAKPMAPNFNSPLPFSPFSTLFENNPNPTHPFWGGSMVSSQSASDSMLSSQSSYLPNPESMLPSDTSKAPGFRPPMQRPSPSQSGIVNMDSSYTSVASSTTHLGTYASNISGGQMYAPGGAPAAANFNRQHFSPLSLLTPCSSASSDSSTQAVSTGVRTQSPSPSGVPMVSEKPNSVSQDRKVPVPIGTERSARIRQTGTSTPSVIGSNLATSVGHSGIWSFEGMGGSQDKVSDWCHTGMGNHMMHRPMSDPGVFSQHQGIERDTSGIVTASGAFHQHVPAGYMDFPKVGGMPFSMYGNAMIPSVAPMPDGTGGPIFNGPHAADPSWNSLIKMVSNSTENGPQTVWTGTWNPHMNSVHMNQMG
ncbi:ankyrin repeat domain-containing protein 17 isoform X8 [Hyla sarda]|uniref:ankyrin repeat domain-containing protein 17 isoform X8 n=1 Tax=Hyla sarda TaxID=327740 RepID=UPI0024C2E4E8|nr:ankyrin repeat domain-containing protein 17 isoform X8 [Hyla sarda]